MRMDTPPCNAYSLVSNIGLSSSPVFTNDTLPIQCDPDINSMWSRHLHHLMDH